MIKNIKNYGMSLTRNQMKTIAGGVQIEDSCPFGQVFYSCPLDITIQNCYRKDGTWHPCTNHTCTTSCYDPGSQPSYCQPGGNCLGTGIEYQ
jgi:hypothetical protein